MCRESKLMLAIFFYWSSKKKVAFIIEFSTMYKLILNVHLFLMIFIYVTFFKKCLNELWIGSSDLESNIFYLHFYFHMVTSWRSFEKCFSISNRIILLSVNNFCLGYEKTYHCSFDSIKKYFYLFENYGFVRNMELCICKRWTEYNLLKKVWVFTNRKNIENK